MQFTWGREDNSTMHTLLWLTVCDLSRSKKWVLKSVLKDLNSAMLYDAEIILFFLTSLISDNQSSSFLCKVMPVAGEGLCQGRRLGGGDIKAVWEQVLVENLCQRAP